MNPLIPSHVTENISFLVRHLIKHVESMINTVKQGVSDATTVTCNTSKIDLVRSS
jgi:hypothetical protein